MSELTSKVIPARVLIVDTETTGLDPNAGAEVIELGAILYSIENQTILEQFSSLLPSSHANQAEAINRIKDTALVEIRDFGLHARVQMIEHMAKYAEYFVAHNAEFDKQFFPLRYMDGPDLPWLCTQQDFEWPLSGDGSNLVSIALAHGVGVSSAHRALADCQLIAALFDRITDLPLLFEKAIKPKPLYWADVPYPGTEAKAAGFVWDRILPRKWAKKLSDEAAASLPFRVIKAF